MKEQHLPRYISASFILVLVFTLAGTAPAQTATINVAANQQTIDGFGFSTAWTPAMTSAQGNLLFGTTNRRTLRPPIPTAPRSSERPGLRRLP